MTAINTYPLRFRFPGRDQLLTSVRAGSCLALAALLALAAGCKKAEPPKPPQPTVTVSKPLSGEVVEWDTFAGRLESPQMANVAAQVSGVIQQAPFQEGALVNKGDTLFVIDPRPFQAAVDSTTADVAKAEAQLAEADVHFRRYDKIRQTKAISAEDYDQAVAALKQAQSQTASAKAAQDRAKLNLEWTKVSAPIGGRVSKKMVTEGNLVNGSNGQATPLTTVMSVDPLYCTVNVPERAFLKYKALAQQQKNAQMQDSNVRCLIQLENESTFAHQGRIDFVDNQVDPNTGTIQIRCVLPNADGALTPGLFARLKIPGSTKHSALLVPDAAVGTDQSNKFLLLVGPDGTVSSKAVVLGGLFGNLRVIADGLKADDKLIINGAQSARPGTKVTPTEGTIPDEALRQLEAAQPYTDTAAS